MTDPRVVTVGSPSTFRQQIARILETDPEEVGWMPSATALEESILQGREWADVVVLSPGVKDPDALGLAEFIGRSSPATAIVLVRERAPNGVLMPAIRAGIRDVVDLSRGSQELKEALARAITWSTNLRTVRAEEQPRAAAHRGKLVTVFSSKGGTGKTFLSCNLAAALSEQTQKNTAIVDMDLGMGDVFTYYGQEPGRPIEDLIAEAARMDREVLMGHATQLREHLFAFGSPPDPANQPVAGEATGKMLRAMRNTFAYTVVDSSADYSDHNLAAFDLSDAICLITGLDVVSIRHLSRALETLLSIGVDREKFRVVLNWADANVGLEPAELERVMKIEVDVMIPSTPLVPFSLNKGRPVYLDQPKSPVARSIAKLADSLADSLSEPEPASIPIPAPPPAPTFVGAPAARGIFRRK